MYAIIVTHYYYAGTHNAPKSGILRDENGDWETFDSHDAASKHMRLLEPNENYRLRHGEYSPPSYRIRKCSR